jgi:hypothetical protein
MMQQEEKPLREDELIEEIYEYHRSHGFTIERGPKAKVEEVA